MLPSVAVGSLAQPLPDGDTVALQEGGQAVHRDAVRSGVFEQRAAAEPLPTQAASSIRQASGDYFAEEVLTRGLGWALAMALAAFVTKRPVLAERFTDRAAAAFCLGVTVTRLAMAPSPSVVVEDHVRFDALGLAFSVLILRLRIQRLQDRVDQLLIFGLQ
jgi:hypothetical protein